MGPGVHPRRHSGPRNARHQPPKAKRSTDSVSGPSCKIEVKGALTAPDEQLMQHVGRLRGELRVAFDPLMRGIRLAILEGPTQVAEAAEALGKSVITANRALHPLEESGEGAQAVYESAEAEFHRRLDKFTLSAREALSSIQ
nr:hypothetical protein StreXyl84_80320 [Streptomyces sp. Xyl84]